MTDVTEAVIELCVVAAVALGVGGALWFAPWRRRSLRRAAPCAPIAELTPGSVATIKGRVVLDEMVESPLTRSRCAYWRLQVSYRERSTSQQGMIWYQGIAREARRDFRLHDATGIIHVAGTCAGFELLPTVHRADLPAHMAELLKSEGVSLVTDKGTPRTFGFEEWVLTEGMEVQVSGRVLAGASGLVVGAPGMPARVIEEKPDWA